MLKIVVVLASNTQTVKTITFPFEHEAEVSTTNTYPNRA